MNDQKIAWDIPMLKRFKKAYAFAVEHKSLQFVFDGHEFLTAYAKYLIQYLDERFGAK